MIAIYAEKPDMGTKIAAALDAIHLSSGENIHFDDLGKFDQKIKSQRTKDGFFEIKYNGVPCKVTWGYGHMCELKQAQDYNKEYKNWKNLPLPFIPQSYDLKLNSGASKQYAVIKKIFMESSEIICATDDDREGDLIFDYLYRYMKCKVPFKRALFNKQAEEEFVKSFNPANLVPGAQRKPIIEAGRARGAGDFVVGAGPTVALTLKYPGKEVFSIGRVQTATLNLIVTREKEIKDFVPKDYFVIKGIFTDGKEAYTGTHKTKRFDKQSDATQILSKLIKNKENGVIKHYGHTDSVKKKPYLYSLQTLQMDANKKYGFSLEEVSKCAQSLYDHGYTTYPRTDSMHLTEDMAPEVEKVLTQLSKTDKYRNFFEGKTIRISNKDKHYFDNNKVDSHYAIIPTSKKADKLSANEEKIYDLIARSVICMLYPDATMRKTTIITDVAGEEFNTTETAVANPGFLEVTGLPKEGIAPKVHGGDKVSGKFRLEAKKTEPPKRYTEGTLLSAMINCGKTIEDEELRELMSKGGDGKPRGLGRPSTQANIVKTLLERKYIRLSKRTIFPTGRGMMLIDILPVEDLKSAVMTAQWEKRLDAIQNGTDTYESFMSDLENAVRVWTNKILQLKGDKRNMAYQEKEKYTGYWNGQEVSFNRQWGTHYFTDEECEALLNGEEIEVNNLRGKDGTKYGVKGKLSEQTYNGHPFIGFERTEYLSQTNGNAGETERYEGIWNGKQITFKRQWSSHRFTDEECQRLVNGETILLEDMKDKSGSKYSVKGALKEQTYRGVNFIGFSPEEYIRDSANQQTGNRPQKEKYSGVWKRKEISFTRTFADYRFTDEECEDLLAGKEIEIHGLVGKNGTTYGIKGKLAKQKYNGHEFVGFQRTEFIDNNN